MRNYSITLLLMLLTAFVIRGDFFQRTLSVNKGSVFLNLAQSSTLGTQNYLTMAQYEFHQAFESSPNNFAIRQKLGLISLLQNREEEAILLWQEIPSISNDLIQWGENFRAIEDYDKAIFWYNLANKFQPERRDSYYFIGLSLKSQGQSDQSLTYYRKALSLPLSAVNTITDTEIYCEIGWTYHWLLESRDTDLALRYYDLALSETVPEYYIGIGDCYFWRAELLLWSYYDPQQAIQDYEKSTALSPRNIQAKANLLLAKYYHSGDSLKALEELQQLIEQYPMSIWGYWRIGDVYLHIGSPENAIIYYKQALETEPYNQQLQNIILQFENP